MLPPISNPLNRTLALNFHELIKTSSIFLSLSLSQIAERLFGITGAGVGASSSGAGQPTASSIRNSKNTADLKLLEKLVTSLIEAQSSGSSSGGASGTSKMQRLRPLSRSFRLPGSLKRKEGGGGQSGTMPTIRESGGSGGHRTNSWSDPNSNVRRVLSSIANAPHRFSQSLGTGGGGDGRNDEERSNLTQNIL